jgi:3',5'-cyclic AMP phosphodiesterase CpdA
MAQHFAQISDPHLTSLEGIRLGGLRLKQLGGYISWRQKRRGQHRPEVLAALQQDLHGDPTGQLLVTGDLTHIGLPTEFEQAARWLQTLGKPDEVAVIPGNHDACVPVPWENSFSLWQEYMNGDKAVDQPQDLSRFPTVRVRGDIAFIGLSTAVYTRWGKASGSVGRNQLGRLAGLLSAIAGRGLFRVLYLHHCPIPGYDKPRKGLTDAAELCDLLTASGVELVLHGHGHHNVQHTLQTKDGDAPVIGVGSASAIGNGKHEVASYKRYTVQHEDGGWELLVDTRTYDRDSGSFTNRQSDSFTLNRPGVQSKVAGGEISGSAL